MRGHSMSRWKGVFHRQGIVGLDLGSYMLKAVQIEPTRDGWRLMQLAQCPTPTDAIRDGVIVQPQEVAEAIKRLLRENGFRASAAVTAIAGAPVIVRLVTLPKMSEAMLRKTIRYEASKYVSTSVEDSYVGFEIVGDVEPSSAEGESQERQMQVLLVVAPREMVDAQIRTLELAGLEAVAIEVEAFALYRALFEMNRTALAQLEGRPAAMVDLGASYTNLYIASQHGFFLTRNIPIAGNTFTQTVQNVLQCSWSEAERFKRTVDFRQLLKRRSTRSRATAAEEEAAPAESAGGGAQEEAVLKALQGQVDELLREVRRSLHYYQSQFPEGSEQGQVTQLVLTGGSSQLNGLAQYAAARLGLEVELGDPFNNPDFDTAHISAEALQMFAPVLGIAVGLAVREMFVEAQRRAA